MTKRLHVWIIILMALCVAACKSAAPAAAPQQFESSVIDSALSNMVETDSVMGVSGLVYLGDQEIYYGQFGYADKEKEREWSRDTLLAIFSMTKPVTGVTLMSLYEDGLFSLDDQLSDYLPEYANMSFIDGVNEDGSPKLSPTSRPIKVIDIFRHTSCFGYGWSGGPAARLMNDANIFDPSKPLSQFSQELSELPLFCDPGTEWKYGVSVDVQARLAEVLSGQPYEDLVKDRVLDPLGLKDTGYYVDEDHRSRIAALYLKQNDGTLKRQLDENVYSLWPQKPIQINGGHGLISSIDDYMRFALMLQNEGKIDGVRILKPETLALMTQDHLPENLIARDFLPEKGQVGFGLDFAVRVAPPADESEPYGVTGEFFWDGAASTLFWVDPNTNITAVFFVQIQPFNGEIQAEFRRAVYEALGMTEG